ncbi:cyclic pyranopterin monophosphate synthase [Synergistales bacterium]|nr:cyclic pyranopterin monophosphate synthase [Synergistales bacterium]
MLDRFEREINYARISITDRCNLRCVYCMPESGVRPLRHADILSYENILRICEVFSALGINKLKITGGEPLVRKGAVDLIACLKQIDGISCVTLTTNGHLLAEHAQKLKEIGLDGVNISLNTLEPSVYSNVTRGGDVNKALAAIDAAIDAGIPSIKLNCVPLGAESRRDVLQVAALARNRVIHVRFIEMMPIGAGFAFTGLSNGMVCEWIEREYGKWTPTEKSYGNGPAKYGALPDFRGKIGFISATSDCFCERCNRVRLTSNGFVRACLNQTDGVSLLPALSEADDDKLFYDIRTAILKKPERHNFSSREESVKDVMSKIGG